MDTSLSVRILLDGDHYDNERYVKYFSCGFKGILNVLLL